jgi:glycosyltransferase involved in cell wall biosynthesis
MGNELNPSTRRLHIALLSPAWPLSKHHNGIVTFVHWMRIELMRHGHEVSVFTSHVDPEDAEPGVYEIRTSARHRLKRKINSLRGKPYDVLKDLGDTIAQTILAVHRRHPIDVIEMEESFGWCADIAEACKIPMVVKLHGPAFLSMTQEELASSAAQVKVEREGDALRRIGAVASPTETTLRQTIHRFGLLPAIQQHITNPIVDVEGLPLWSLEGCDQKTILFVGRFDKRKGGDVVLEAFALLLKERPDLRLIFVGPDVGLLEANGSKVMFDEHLERVVPAALRARVDYRGRMPNSEIAELRTRAMLTIIASRWENLGYAALEAMLQGCPVVCSDAGACPEIFDHGVTGLLAKSADPAAFAEQIEVILDGPAHAEAMGVAARKYVIETNSADKVATASLDLYRRVIASARAEGAPA